MDELTLSPSLADELLPFSMRFSTEGHVLALSRLLRQVWEVPESDAGEDGFSLDLVLTRPFRAPFDGALLGELTNLIVHLSVAQHPERIVRGQLYPHADGWLFTGFPRVSHVGELESIGLSLSRLPLHTAMGEFLIANEASAASLQESQRQATRLSQSNDTLATLNQRFARFVPNAFLQDIGIDTAVDVELGRHVETKKSIMFADLRQFTTLSEQLDASQIFEVINGYLACTVPCIEAYGGYVIQYLGDGIMALFPHDGHAALRAAIEMQGALKACCAEKMTDLPMPIRMSIGIHDGPVALGIVGNENRWDASIIADAVNTAARIESMTRVLGGEIIISGSCLDSVDGAHGFATRELGMHEIRGRQGRLRLVEVLDGLDELERSKRAETREAFQAGLGAYGEGELYEAMSQFSRVLSMVPDDAAAQYYLARVSQRLQSLPK